VQRVLGNQTLGRLVQARLVVNPPRDGYEVEADRVADAVMRMPVATPVGRSASRPTPAAPHVRFSELPLQREAKDDDEPLQAMPLQREAKDDDEPLQAMPLQRRAKDDDELVQARRTGTGAALRVTADLETRLRASEGGGRALPDALQTFYASRLGRDFGGVRIHTGAEADHLNRSLNAQAFTRGARIYFAAGKFAPDTRSGMHLLTHELTHVVQQGQAGPATGRAAVSAPAQTRAVEPVQRDLVDDAAVIEDRPPTEPERESALARARAAEARAVRAANDGEARVVEYGGAATPVVQREQTSRQSESRAAPAAADSARGGPAKAPLAADGASDASSTPVEATDTEAGGAADRAADADVPAAADQAPVSAAADPAFQTVVGAIRVVAARQRAHAPATAKAREAQAAAVAPAREIQGRAQANQVSAMQAAPMPGFDAAAFKRLLLDKLAAIAPKNQGEAKEFKNDNKLAGVKASMQAAASAGAASAQAPLAEQTEAAPDTSRVEPKPVSPLPAADAGPKPTAVGAERAVPKAKGQSEVEAPLAAESQALDQQMADGGVTPAQIERSNEPEFTDALAAKHDAQTDAVTAPAAYREMEQGRLAEAEANATATARQLTQGMHAERAASFGSAATQQAGAKAEDEKARAQVGTDIDAIYARTKATVEGILRDLDGKVARVFDDGAAAAKRTFEDFVDARMEAWKAERYDGLLGKGRWVKDLFMDLPDEVNRFYEDGRKQFLKEMDGVVDQVVAIIGTELTRAKTEIANGKQKVQDYISELPASLQAVGQQAAAGIQEKFDALEQSVDDKQGALIDTLASKYQENLQAVDARIAELKEANRGLASKAADKIKAVIDTILKLKDLLLSVLARVADVVAVIIADPIAFLGNLVKGVGQGFESFADNIEKHLIGGLVTWLTGALGPMGIQIPEEVFSLKGIFSLVMQILGLTWDYIRAKAVKLLGEPVVKALEKGFELFEILQTKGAMGLWGYIKEELGDLKDLVLGQIQEIIASEVVKAGIKWILGLLNPASAFVKAAMAIYDIVMFFVNKAGQIADLISAIVDAVAAIAGGAVGGAAKLVENALARAVPVVIGLLASLLGIGDLAKKVQAVVEKVRKKVDGLIDKLMVKAKAAGQKLLGKQVDGEQDAALVTHVEAAKTTFHMAEESHSISVVHTPSGLMTEMSSETARPILDAIEAQIASEKAVIESGSGPQKGRAKEIVGILDGLKKYYNDNNNQIKNTKNTDDIGMLRDAMIKKLMSTLIALGDKYGLKALTNDALGISNALKAIGAQVAELRKHLNKPGTIGDGHSNTAAAAEALGVDTGYDHMTRTKNAIPVLDSALKSLQEIKQKHGIDVLSDPGVISGVAELEDSRACLKNPAEYLRSKGLRVITGARGRKRVKSL